MDQLPSRYRAIQIPSADAAPVLVEVDLPVPGPNQVLVKVDSAPINPYDVGTIKGYYGNGSFPLVPGVEGSGVVVS